MIGLLIASIAVLLLILWSVKRRPNPHLHINSDDSLEKLVTSLASLCLSTPIEGNRVEIIEDGAFFDVMMEEIAAAEPSIHFETFLWKEGELSTRIASTLCERARGVTVRVLLDAAGFPQAQGQFLLFVQRAAMIDPFTRFVASSFLTALIDL